jgi:mannosylfructose-phosphate synthase
MTPPDPELARDLVHEVGMLFAQHGLPEADPTECAGACHRIAMISTHGYWSDPPPAGATDTGGQTLYVLQLSRECARAGRRVVILVRWFAPYPRVERLEPNLWLVRIPAGGDRFVRKEDIHPLAPELAEYATAVAARFGAQAVMGHYADGMVVAAEVATRLGLPLLAMPHSLALTKIAGLGLSPDALATWFDDRYRFGTREEYELAALTQADGAIGCLPDQLDVLSRVYPLRTPRDVIAPGVAPVFFEAGDAPPDAAVPARFGLVPEQFLIATARLAETKNIPGAVALLGQARALAPARFDRVVLAVVGGTAEPREPEELAVAAQIEAAMARHGLDRGDVRRIPAQSWPVVAQLVRQSLFYVGMQHFEPFGMGAAEALAVGAPVLLSRCAGIARAIQPGAPADRGARGPRRAGAYDPGRAQAGPRGVQLAPWRGEADRHARPPGGAGRPGATARRARATPARVRVARRPAAHRLPACMVRRAAPALDPRGAAGRGARRPPPDRRDRR